MKARFLVHILKILKKWLSQFARIPTNLFVFLLSLPRHFSALSLKLGDRPTRFSTGALQGDVAREDVLSCSSLPGSRFLEVAGESSSPSDSPYSETHARLSRYDIMEVPSPEANQTTEPYPTAAESYGPRPDSVSISHLSQQTGDSPPSSPRIPHNQKGKGVDPAERARKKSSVDSGPSLKHPASQLRTSSVNGHASLSPSVRSIAGLKTQQAEYQTHTESLHSGPGGVRSCVSVTGINHYWAALPGDAERPGSEVGSVYDFPPITAIVADEARRYERRITRTTGCSGTMVPAMMTAYPVHDTATPLGWFMVMRPEGSFYFMNPENRTSTEIDICNEDIFKNIKYYMEYLLVELQRELRRRELWLDMRDVDLVIEPPVSGETDRGYYFINHRDRCLFWLDDFDVERFSYCQGIKSLAHIGLAIQAQYWKHWDRFPSLCPVTHDLLSEVENMLVHATCDHLASKQSSAPYDVSVLSNYLSVISKIKVPPASQSVEQRHAAIVIGQIMHEFSYNAFLNFDTKAASKRRGNRQAILGWVYTPSRWMVIVAPVLFLEPVTQVQELHKILADNVARMSRWNAFSSRMKSQLQDSNLLATVFLSANVGFLGVIRGGGSSATQVTSYMSLTTSLGSLVLGLFFVSQDRISGQSITNEALSFLWKLFDERHGLDTLAIIYSLPKALLMWSIVFFFASFLINWWTSGDTTSRAVVGTAILFTIVVIAHSIIRTREGDLWWPINQLLGGIGLLVGALSPLVSAWNKGLEIVGISRTQRNHDDGPETNQFSMGIPVRPFGVNAGADNPMRSSASLENPNPSSTTTSAASVHSPRQSVSPDQPTGEARNEPELDHTSSYPHFATSTMVNELSRSGSIPTKAVIPSEHEGRTAAVATDSSAATISADPLCAEERESMKCIVDEPQVFEIPQVRESTAPSSRIPVKGATGDELYHAPPAAKETPEDNGL